MHVTRMRNPAPRVVVLVQRWPQVSNAGRPSRHAKPAPMHRRFPPAAIRAMPYHGPSLTRETGMGSCQYCTRGAGWFRTSHRGCRDVHRSGLPRMVDLATRAVERPEFTQRRVLQVLARLSQECHVPDETCPRCWRPDGTSPP